MQVQKLVIIARGFSLALLDRSLFENNIHAWQWGPVIPKLYKVLQKVTEELAVDTEESVAPDSDEFGIIKAVWNSYGKFSGGQLSALTHKPDTPWWKTWEKTRFGVIPIDTIKNHYLDLLEARN